MKKCPLCEGFGKIGNKKFSAREEEVKALRAKGLTFRQIAKVTGIKSTNTIDYYLTK